MACKNCKSSKVSQMFNNGINSVKGNPQYDESELRNRLWDDSMGKLNKKETYLMWFFGWFPLIVGYYTIIRFLISIF